MPKQDIIIDIKKIDRLTIELKGFEKQVGEATYHALNRTLDYTVTQIGRIVPKYYAIKAKEVKESIAQIKRPTKANLAADIIIKGHRLSFVHFPHSPKIPLKRKYKVKVNIKHATKTVSTNPLPFIAHTGAKSLDKVQFNIFKREGKNRFPITVLRTLAIPQMITNEEVAELIREKANKKLEERLEHEIILRMTGFRDKVKKG